MTEEVSSALSQYFGFPNSLLPNGDLVFNNLIGEVL